MIPIRSTTTEKGERKLQSHQIAKSLRPGLQQIAAKFGARIKVAEVPPGPPVLQTLVAEVYGPDEETRVSVAQKVKQIFNSTEGVADVDWYVDDDQKTLQYAVDQHKAAQSGVGVDQINRAIATALGGSSAGMPRRAKTSPSF